MTRKLEILVLNPNETYAGFLDPEVTDITETNKYGGIRELHIQHPLDDETQDYDKLLKLGNKIWQNETEDTDSCLYILNDDKQKDLETNILTITAEEVLVELNDAGVVSKSTTTTQTINGANLTNWFGDYYTIGTVDPAKNKTSILWQGTMTRMKLLRFIEEESGNTFKTQYTYTEDSNGNSVILRHLHLLQDPGETHTTPLELGENVDSIQETEDEGDSYTAFAPVLKEQQSTGELEEQKEGTDNKPKLPEIMENYYKLRVNQGESIPMFYKVDTEGNIIESETVMWNAPYPKDADSWEVHLPSEDVKLNYSHIYKKYGTGNSRRVGTTETSEHDKYMIYNACALRLMEKKDPIYEVNTKVLDLPGLRHEDKPYNVGDIVHIRTRNGGIVSARVEETKKNPRNRGQSDIKIGNILSRVLESREQLDGHETWDSYTKSRIYGRINDSIDIINDIGASIPDAAVQALIGYKSSGNQWGTFTIKGGTYNNRPVGMRIIWTYLTDTIEDGVTTHSMNVNFTNLTAYELVHNPAVFVDHNISSGLFVNATVSNITNTQFTCTIRRGYTGEIGITIRILLLAMVYLD